MFLANCYSYGACSLCLSYCSASSCACGSWSFATVFRSVIAVRTAIFTKSLHPSCVIDFSGASAEAEPLLHTNAARTASTAKRIYSLYKVYPTACP